MALRFKDPMVEMVKVSGIIQAGDEVGLTNPDIRYPVTFHPQVIRQSAKTLGLDLPEQFWDVVNVQTGLRIQITKTIQSHMYYLEGEISEANRQQSPNLVIKHGDKILCAQRRLFYRFNLKKNFHLTSVLLPDSSARESVKVTLQDMSPAGIGFKSPVQLPAGTRCEVTDLFDPVIPAMESIDYFMEVVWCRGSKLPGYRCGAIFKFPSEQEQDSFGHVLSQLQINRLAWYYHNLQNNK